MTLIRQKCDCSVGCQMVLNILIVYHEIQAIVVKSAPHLLHTQCRVDIQIVRGYQIYFYVQKSHLFPT